MSKVYAYLDSNVFLHFKSVGQIPWCDLLQATEVELVVPAQVLKEINDKKDHGSSKLRKRARAAISELKRLCPPGNVSGRIADSVDLRVRTREPQIDWNAEHLSESNGDDRIIAEMMVDAHECAVIVGHDAALQYKVLGKKFAFFELPSDYRLPEEPTEKERENRELREKLRKFEAKAPALAVRFSEEAPQGCYRLQRPASADCEYPDIDGLVEERIAELRYRPVQLPGVAGVAMAGMYGVPDSEVARYNSELEKYAAKYRAYIELRSERERTLCATLGLDLTIENSGSSPATGVDIRARFTGLRSLFSEDELPDEPTEPGTPTRPRPQMAVWQPETPRSQYSSPLLSARLPNMVLPHPPDVPTEPEVDKDEDGAVVTWSLQRLKHLDRRCLPTIYVAFGTPEDMRSFGIEYWVRADNHPEPFEGTLHVVIE